MGSTLSVVLGNFHSCNSDCPHCGQSQGRHEDGCVQGRYEAVVKEIDEKVSKECPECQKGQVLPNAEGLYECQRCHSLFVKVPPGGIKSKVFLKTQSGPVMVYDWFMEKGSGTFPLIQRLKAAEKALANSKRRLKKKRNKARAQRQ